MVVDDEHSIRVMLKRVLSDWQYEFHEAASGAEVLNRIEKEKYSAILLDLKMPDLNGLLVI